MLRRRQVSGGLAGAIVFLSAEALFATRGMSKEAEADGGDVAEILHRRVNVEKRSVGMASVRVTPNAVQVVCEGREGLSDRGKVSDETIFEIGSVTKIFTALLLAGCALDGRLSVTDPVAKHLPGDFVLPERDGRLITLADLATHTAGFPRFPTMNSPSLQDYSLSEFKTWLASFQLPRAPGAAWEYSNLGYALIGLALSYRAGRSYEQLLKDKLLGPLGLNDSLLYPPANAAHLAEGHDGALKPVPPAALGIFAPAGSLRSSPRDMGRFMRALMPGSGSFVEPLNRSLLEIVRPAPPAGGKQALGWEILPAREGEFLSKDGVTAGQCASAVYDARTRRSFVVLSNTFPSFTGRSGSPSGGGIGAADVARRLLRPSIQLEA